MAQFEENFVFVDYDAEGKSLEQIERELGGKIRDGEIDAYLIVPENYGDRKCRFSIFLAQIRRFYQ